MLMVDCEKMREKGSRSEVLLLKPIIIPKKK
jgi:hypothetical protein